MWMISVKIAQCKLVHPSNSTNSLIVSTPLWTLQELSPINHSDVLSPSLARLFLYQYSVLNVFNQNRCFPFFLLFFFSHTKSFIFALVPQSPSICQDKQSIFTYSIQNHSLLSSPHSSWNCNSNHQPIDKITLSHQNNSFCSLSFDRFSIFASISYLASV